MLSYRHAFHAGNHADILKHIVLTLIIKSLNNKDKPYTLIDSHAGAGRYALDDPRLLKTGEAQAGIEKLLQEEKEGKIPEDIASIIEPYLNLVKSYAQQGMYPGSPEIESSLMRAQDNLILMELHNTEIEVLKQNMNDDFEQKTRLRPHIHHRNGFEGIKAMVPPTPRRGLVFTDPSYETDEDYLLVSQTFSSAIKKWPRGIFVLWYPLLHHRVQDIASMKQSILSAAQIFAENAEIADFELSLS